MRQSTLLARWATNIFQKNCALITSPIAVSQSWHEASGIDLEQRLRLFVRIDFDVLIGYAFKLESYPYSLNKWTAGYASVQTARGLIL